jgi:hypothetical protein
VEEFPYRLTGGPGWVIGYDYLANHPKIMDTWWGWKSPLRLSDKGMLAVWCDANHWSPEDGWTIVPHGANGGTFITSGGGCSTEFGAVGGNVGYIDGSVQWKRVDEMEQRSVYSGNWYAYRAIW